MFQSVKNLGHSLTASAESVLYVRDTKIAKARVLAVGAVFGAVFLVSTTNLALAASDLKTLSNSVAQKTNAVPNVVAYIAYLSGAVLAALGIVDLKKHVENPSQTPMKNGLAKLGFGGALLALPAIVQAMQGTTGVKGQTGPTMDTFSNQPTNF